LIPAVTPRYCVQLNRKCSSEHQQKFFLRTQYIYTALLSYQQRSGGWGKKQMVKSIHIDGSGGDFTLSRTSILQKRVYETDINSYNSFVTWVDVQSNIFDL
jgi:hypothetical protein